MADPGDSLSTQRIGPWLREGWRLTTEDLTAYLAAGLACTAIGVLLSWFSHGLLLPFAVGPLAVGLYLVILGKTRSGTTKLSLFWSGFKHGRFAQAVLVSVLLSVFAAFGLLLCVIGVLFVCTIYSFALVHVAAENPGFWQAMEWSRRRVTPNLWPLFWFQVALLVINLLGLAACGVGLVFTLPLTMAANVVAYLEFHRQGTVPGAERPA